MKLMNIVEALTYKQDLVLKIDTTSNGGTQYSSKFSIDGENFELYFNLWEITLVNIVCDMAEFGYKRIPTDGTDPTQKRTPSKVSSKVHGLVLHAMLDFVQKHHVKVLVFSAKRDNDDSEVAFDTRSMIYDRIATRLMSLLGMSLVNDRDFSEYIKRRKLTAIKNLVGRHWLLTRNLTSDQQEALAQFVKNLVLVPNL